MNTHLLLYENDRSKKIILNHSQNCKNIEIKKYYSDSSKIHNFIKTIGISIFYLDNCVEISFNLCCLMAAAMALPVSVVTQSSTLTSAATL